MKSTGFFCVLMKTRLDDGDLLYILLSSYVGYYTQDQRFHIFI